MHTTIEALDRLPVRGTHPDRDGPGRTVFATGPPCIKTQRGPAATTITRRPMPTGC